MNLLLVADSYTPEVSSAAVLMKQLAEALKARGHDVTVLTTIPQSMSKLREEDRGRHWPECVHEDGVCVVRARTFSTHHPRYVVRGFAVLLAPFQMLRALSRHWRKPFDAAFIYSPPITLGFAGAMLRRKGARIVFNVQDIFPQNAIDLGILRNPLLIAMFRWIERFSYRHSDRITAHSDGNLQLLASANPDVRGKLVILHNWVELPAGEPPDIAYRRKHGLEGRFIALFAGVLGPSQAVHMIVELAARVADLRDLTFLIVGEGAEKKRAEDLVAAYNLTNVVFRPFISPSDYPSLLKEIDLGLVTLTTSVKTPVVPGKMLGYMVAGIPVAAFVNAESDVHALMRDADCGMSAVSSDLDAMERIMRDLHGDRAAAKAMGVRGRAYAIEHLSKDRIVLEIEAMMKGEV